MPGTPRLITAVPHRPPPRGPRVTASDLPRNAAIRQPGEKYYHGRTYERVRPEDHQAMRNIAEVANERARDERRLFKKPNGYQVIGGLTLGTAGAIPVATGALIPRARRKSRAQAEVFRRRAEKVESSIGKAARVPRFSVDDLGLLRNAQPGKGGAHTIHSMDDRTSRIGRTRQAVGRVAERVGRMDENAQELAVLSTAPLAIGIAAAGTAGPRKELRDQRARYNRALSSRRRANAAELKQLRSQQGVAKLYVRDQQTSVPRLVTAGAGLALGAWGVGRSRMVGAALGRGVKMATSHQNPWAIQALQAAQAAQGVLARGTAPGERALRQIRAVDRAVSRVPSSIRPEIAMAAGTLLVGHSRPIRRETYHPVNIRVRTNGGF